MVSQGKRATRTFGYLLQWSHVFSDMVRGRGSDGTGYRPPPASMEPCLFRHGKGGLAEDPRADPLASMEPCLFRHGKEQLSGTILDWNNSLQWSHVFSDMVRVFDSLNRPDPI